MDRDLRVVLSARVFSDQKCFGPGVSQLLKRVDELHSLRAAGHVPVHGLLQGVDGHSQCGKRPGFSPAAVQHGGRNGGGAALTDEARLMLAAYDEYCEKLRAYGEKLFEETFAFYDDIPKQEVHKKEERHE